MSESKCPYKKDVKENSNIGEKKEERSNKAKCPYSGYADDKNNGNNDKSKEESKKKDDDSSDDEKPTGGCPVMNKSNEK